MCYAARGRLLPASSAERDPAIARFQDLIAPCLDAAFNLAVWLTGSKPGAEDVVLGACLSAFQELRDVRDKQVLVWLLAIVHAACYRWIQDKGADEQSVRSEQSPARGAGELSVHRVTPEHEGSGQEVLTALVAALPIREREVLILHEIEHLTFREIAAVTNASVGTTRSRLLFAQRHMSAWQRTRGGSFLVQPVSERQEPRLFQRARRADEKERKIDPQSDVERSDQTAVHDISC
jgi:RNA polymerase sigma factor (sigma-70 family)